MSAGDRSRRALGAWIDLMMHRAWWVVAISVAASMFCAYYAVGHLSINTDDADLISADVGWRQDYRAYQKAYPEYTDNLVIVIDGATRDVASHAVKTLAAALRARPRLFEDVYIPGGGAFFARNGLLYLEPDALSDLSTRLNRIQPFLGRLSATPTLPTFFSLLDQAMAPDAAADFDLEPVFTQLARVFEAEREGRFAQLSWQRLMGGDDQPGSATQRFIIVAPKLDYSRLLPADPAMRAVRALASAHDLDAEHGVRVRLTGEAALSDEELSSVTQGAAWGAALALLAVGVILYLGLRSFRLMGAALAALVVGLVGTAAFAALAVGRLNLISIAFAVLYIGLGIDYAIHLCLRYREIANEHSAPGGALRRAVDDVGPSLMLCAITTAGGFLAFVPTAYSGVAELGVISGAGMFISLMVSLSLLPALIALTGAPGRSRGPRGRAARDGARRASMPRGRRVRRVIWISAGAIALAGMAALPYLRFDDNTLNLKNPDSESVKTYRELLENSERSPLTLVTSRPTLTAARTLADRLDRQPAIFKAMTLADFIPAHQQQKLAIIGDLALTLALSPPDMTRRAALDDRRRAIAAFAAALAAYRARIPEAATDAAAGRLGEALAAWRAHVKTGVNAQRAYARLYHALFDGFGEQIKALNESLRAGRVTRTNLPTALRTHWIGRHGGYRVEAFARADLDEPGALATFVKAGQAVAPHITGAPVLQFLGGRTVAHAFEQAFIYATIFITLVLWVLLRSIGDTLRVLAPLALSGLILAGASVALNLPFNFANVIALPLLLGIGVDSGIHVVYRLRQRRRVDGAFWATSTARAVILSSLTTMAGFGSLAFSHHAGTASMGKLLAIGMVAILITTLIVVPSLFAADDAQ